jgi:acyl dehydratase
MSGAYLEDLSVRQKFGSGRLEIDAERIKSFAAEFDPQPFHLDDAGAAGTVFDSLAASGWYTAAATMRLLVESAFKPVGGIVALAIDELHWPRPVRPGDELHVESEILEVTPSRSRPDRGTVKVRVTTFNQSNAPVQTLISTLMLPRRPPRP